MQVVSTQGDGFLSFADCDEAKAMFVHWTQRASVFNTWNKVIIKAFCGHWLPLTRGLISFNGKMCCNHGANAVPMHGAYYTL